MPIIELLADPQTPLSQGDVLKGVPLFATVSSWQVSGKNAHQATHSLCLVLSRPCVALRQEWVVVAAIEKYKNKPPDTFASLEEAEEFYREIRDGLTTPNQFYLGQITGHEGSFCARFNSLHTIQLPKENTPERQAFLATARVGRLHKDFLHDLHLRLFRAFASLGFDDHGWFSSEDLRAFVAVADREESKKRTELLEIQAKLQVGQSQGFHHESEKKKLEKQESACLQEHAELVAKIKPYKDELTKRDQGSEVPSN